MTPEHRVSLAPHTSLRVGGPADFFVLASSARDMAEALQWALDRELQVRVIGGGLNVLVADAGFDGLVVKAAHNRTEVRRDGVEPSFVAEAGANLANQARRLAKQDLGGLEWAANVPGTVGGAVVNNAGAFAGDTASALICVTLLNARGERLRLGPGDLSYAYRTSVLKRRELGEVAVEVVELRLRSSPPGE